MNIICSFSLSSRKVPLPKGVPVDASIGVFLPVAMGIPVDNGMLTSSLQSSQYPHDSVQKKTVSLPREHLRTIRNPVENSSAENSSGERKPQKRSAYSLEQDSTTSKKAKRDLDIKTDHKNQEDVELFTKLSNYVGMEELKESDVNDLILTLKKQLDEFNKKRRTRENNGFFIYSCLSCINKIMTNSSVVIEGDILNYFFTVARVFDQRFSLVDKQWYKKICEKIDEMRINLGYLGKANRIDINNSSKIELCIGKILASILDLF